MDAPVRAGVALLGISLSRTDRPKEWVTCYLYATQGANVTTPSCTDQLGKEFRSGAAGDIAGWHSVAMSVDSTHGSADFSTDGRAAGALRVAKATATTKWYLLLSGWSGDGQPVEGAITDISVGCPKSP